MYRNSNHLYNIVYKVIEALNATLKGILYDNIVNSNIAAAEGDKEMLKAAAAEKEKITALLNALKQFENEEA